MVETRVESAVPRYEYAPPKRAQAPVVLLPGLFAGGWMWDETRLKRLVDRLELGRVSLCGNSFGALAALDFAVHQPEAVESIVVSGAPGLSPDVNAGIGVPRSVRREDVVELAHKMFHNPARATPAMIDRTHAILSERRHVHNVVRALRTARDYRIADALSRLACRSLLVWGANDAITPAAPWERAAHAVDRCTFRTVPRCGHSPMIERPHKFNRILLEFLTQGGER